MKLKLTAVAGLLLALAACSPASAPSAPSTGEEEQAVNAPLVPSEAASPSNGADACSTRRLGIRVSRQEGEAGGQVRARLILSNTGTNTCSLNGWPKLALSRNGRQVDTAPSMVNEPATPSSVSLGPGQSAFAGLRWEPCDPGSAGCADGGQLLVGAPGSDLVQAELSDFSLAEREQLAMRSIVIGSIQPTGKRINDW
jgi:hypothetical protein